MRRNNFGVPIFYSDEKLLKHVTEKQGMDYNDEHYGNSKIAYDGELIDLTDAQYRLKRDKARQRNYARAEERLDDQQMTWTDVENTLNTHI